MMVSKEDEKLVASLADKQSTGYITKPQLINYCAKQYKIIEEAKSELKKANEHIKELYKSIDNSEKELSQLLETRWKLSVEIYCWKPDHCILQGVSEEDKGRWEGIRLNRKRFSWRKLIKWLK